MKSVISLGFIALLFHLMPTISIGQTKITTEFGQVISVMDDGSWQVMESPQDTLTYVNSNPFEKPQISNQGLTVKQQSALNELKIVLLIEDARKAASLNRLAVKEEIMTNNLNQSRSLGNEYLIDSFQLLVNQIKDSISATRLDYQHLIKDLKVLGQMDSEKNMQVLEANIKILQARWIGNTTLGSHTYNSPKRLAIDERKPWDIKGDCTELGLHRNIENNRVNLAFDFEVLFHYTPPRLANYHAGSNFLEGRSSLVRSGGEFFIELELRFASKDAQKSYGVIEKGSFLRIELITGQKIFLKAVRTSVGQIEQYSGNTLYKVQYEFSEKADLKSLRSTLIDQVGILWSTGFEPYPVYQIDFFVNRLSCIDESN